MTENQRMQSILYSSYLMYLLDAHLEDKNRQKGSVIKLKQKLLKYLREEKNKDLVQLSNDIWFELINEYKDKNYHIVVFDAIESLVFEAEEYLTKAYGGSFLQQAANVVYKITGNDEVPKEYLKESREIMDRLIELTRKRVYDYLKEK